MEIANIETLIEASRWPFIVIGLLGVFIAWQQYRTNKTKVQFELYNKRFAIYDTVMAVINTALDDESIDEKDYRRFLTAYNEAQFLLPNSVLKSLSDPKDLIFEYGIKTRTLRRRRENNKGDLDEEIQTIIDEITSIEDKLEELTLSITNAFMKVLKFNNI